MARYIDADKIQYRMVPTIRGTGMMTFKDMIDKIPTADVRPERHGVWIYGETICSICGAEWGEDETDYFCYCPCCGAKMDGKDEE